jgi:AraC-like DNA-binding protein
MDTLSQLLDDIHLAGVEFRYLQAQRPWGYAFRAGGLSSFHLVLTGAAILRLAGQPPLRLEAGDMAIVTGGQDHEVVDVEEAPPGELGDLAATVKGHGLEPLVIGGEGALTNMLSARFSFDAELARPLLSALPPVLLMRGLNERPPEWMRIGLEFLGQEGVGRPGRQAIVNHLGDILFIECVRDYVEALPEGANNWLLALRDPALSAVLSALHREPERAWTVPELAQTACLSRSAFADRFGSVMGKPPLTYLAEHRMRLAVWQLRHTQQPVCRIAEMVGYGSETAFSQAFKRIYGSSPSRFRQQSENEQANNKNSAPAAPVPLSGQAG